MNFLAHLYLSGDHDFVKLGNFIGDFVKGRNLNEQYPAEIARGIWLHRAIDEYTDAHPVVKKSKDRLRPTYRHYAPVIVDVFYDHFLAKNWTTYSDVPLTQYAEETYELVRGNGSILPERFMNMMKYMMQGNWLVHYATTDGIHQALSGMSRRSRFDSKMDQSVIDLKEHYSDFEMEFSTFFPELKAFSESWLNSNPA
ncbi:MAG TPA: ACP phosphodiesterase [Cyclobacteriaceae bacterium]|nr:ACP phosphodiesterase [Cyclobacteriaceae bacterium]